ncbi:Pr6Pr family membrane protein [Streptomyces sp. Tue6028]|uniref:Pr6Pr family membrane protein n=1 Tax=Streptomyces sp. Tue6028 TaxID=2036037 RepID=UPI000D1BAB8E
MTAPIPRDIPDLPAIPGIASPITSSFVPATAVVAPTRRPRATAFRIFVALVAAAGVTIDLLAGSALHVLAYFTIQANILVAVTFAVSARRAWAARRPLSGAVTGATLLYIVITGLVYHLILTDRPGGFSMTGEAGAPTGWPWVADQLLHTVTPIVVIADWLLLTHPGRTALRHAATWVLYPLFYLVFSLIRGAMLAPGTPDRYLYPFVDVDRHGYVGILGNTAILGLGFYALALVTIAVDHLRPDPVRPRARRP